MYVIVHMPKLYQALPDMYTGSQRHSAASCECVYIRQHKVQVLLLICSYY